jgi:hypothetical protein
VEEAVAEAHQPLTIDKAEVAERVDIELLWEIQEVEVLH